VVLAKTEYTVEQGTMPPHRYLLLHWNGGLSDSEKEDLLAWTRKVRSGHYTTPGVADTLKTEPVQPLPAEHGQDPGKVALGNKIYHDKRLSGDDTISCATCHGLDKGGTDRLRFSKGIDDAVGDINAPTVFNAGYQVKQFWDGRAADLEEQADGPVNNPIEMGANWPDVIAKLEKDEEFVREFKSIYPDGLKKEHFLDAIATFERSLITPNSKFDRYLMGNDAALSADEREGYAKFKEHGCATCHVGKILGGRSFEKMGREADYFEDRGDVGKPDYGRFNVTANEKDRFKLKVPTLRNIALTAPYFHDGTRNDLHEVVRIMSEYQSGIEASDRDVDLMVKFLMTLTGEYDGKLLQ
jgi:cytochrome c peroxidase